MMKLPGVEGEPGSDDTEHNGGWKKVHRRQNRRLNDGQVTGSLEEEIKKLQRIHNLFGKPNKSELL